MTHDVHIIGGGLAGSEAAWQLAQAGLKVRLSEMRGSGEMTPAEIATPESVCAGVGEKTVFVGSGALLHENLIRDSVGENAVFLPANLNTPRASGCALLGRKRILSGRKDDPFTLTPFYLRRSAAEREAVSAERK